MRVALHEKTARVRARQGALELRERELAASECVCPRLPFSSLKHARSKARAGELTGGPPVRWFVISFSGWKCCFLRFSFLVKSRKQGARCASGERSVVSRVPGHPP